eukprot:4235619-Heterocapsa_arctica.AAC.1
MAELPSSGSIRYGTSFSTSKYISLPSGLMKNGCSHAGQLNDQPWWAHRFPMLRTDTDVSSSVAVTNSSRAFDQ